MQREVSHRLGKGNGARTLRVEDWIADWDRRGAGDPSRRRADLLSVAVERLGGAGGAIWSADRGGELRLECQVGLGRERIDRVHDDWPGHADLLQSVLRTGEPQSVAARFEPTGDAPGDSGRELTLLVSPLPARTPDRRTDFQSVPPPGSVVEVIASSDRLLLPPGDALTALQDFCRTAALSAPTAPQEPTSESPESLAGFADFCRHVHASLDPTPTATAIANAARAWIGCDRVTVLLHRDPKWRVAAISGMSAFDRRSGAVRRLQSVVGSVLAPASGGREPAGAAWIAPAAAVPGVSAAEDLSDAARAEIDAFRDEVQYRHLAILPLTNVVDSLRESADRSRSQPSPLGALVLEHFTDAGWDSPLRRRAELAADQGGAALSAVREHRALPLFPFVRALQRLGWRSKGRTLSRWLLAAIVAAAIIAALTLVPTDFDITGNGELQPKLRRHVFATLRGTVESLDVRHGQQVAEGQSLLRLRSPELDFELTRVQGELRTTEQQIADLGAVRTGLERPGAAARQSSVELAAREEELKSVLANLTEQLAVLRRQQAELSVASPIAGEVLTWDVEEILASRPVEPGHRLLTVADAAGAWVVEVRVPDRDISHVLAARRENNEGPDVSFVVATDLEREQHGQVIDVANAVEHDPVEGPTLLVTVAVDREQLGDVRPGASVYPRIHCGRRAVGYVWFRRAIEAVVAWWRF